MDAPAGVCIYKTNAGLMSKWLNHLKLAYSQNKLSPVALFQFAQPQQVFNVLRKIVAL